MKKFFILCTLLSIFVACQQATTPAKDDNESAQDSTTEASTNQQEQQAEEPVADEMVIGPAVTKIEVLASKKAEDEPGEQDIKIDLGNGYTLEEKGTWFSGVEWAPRALEIKKDGETLHTWTNEDRTIVIRNRKFETDYPRLVTKGDKALIFFDIVIPPNGMAIDAVGIEDGKFVGVMEDIKKVYLDKPETVEPLFSK